MVLREGHSWQPSGLSEVVLGEEGWRIRHEIKDLGIKIWGWRAVLMEERGWAEVWRSGGRGMAWEWDRTGGKTKTAWEGKEPLTVELDENLSPWKFRQRRLERWFSGLRVLTACLRASIMIKHHDQSKLLRKGLFQLTTWFHAGKSGQEHKAGN